MTLDDIRDRGPLFPCGTCDHPAPCLCAYAALYAGTCRACGYSGTGWFVLPNRTWDTEAVCEGCYLARAALEAAGGAS